MLQRMISVILQDCFQLFLIVFCYSFILLEIKRKRALYSTGFFLYLCQKLVVFLKQITKTQFTSFVLLFLCNRRLSLSNVPRCLYKKRTRWCLCNAASHLLTCLYVGLYRGRIASISQLIIRRIMFLLVSLVNFSSYFISRSSLNVFRIVFIST